MNHTFVTGFAIQLARAVGSADRYRESHGGLKVEKSEKLEKLERVERLER
jgi:hypothetical protein